jgi:tetratricopeptide (TPR) repeat protein
MAQMADQMQENILSSWGYGNIAYILEQQGKLGEALQMRRKSSEVINPEKDPRIYADYNHNVGAIFLKLGKMDSATHYFKQAIELDRKTNNKQGMIHDLLFLIELNFRGGKLDEALTSCNQCLKLGSEIQYSRGLAMCNYLKADVLLQLQQYQEALYHVDKAIDIDSTRNDFTRMAQIYTIKANILRETQSSSAERWYLEAIDLARKNNNIQAQCKAGLALSTFYREKGEVTKSNNLLEEVNHWSQGKDLQSVRSEYLDHTYLANKKEGNYGAALKYLEERAELLKNDNQELLEKQATNIDQSFDLFQIERELDQLAFEKEINELRAKRRNNIFISIGVALLLTSLLGYFAFQNQKNKNAVIEKTAKENELRSNNRILEKEMDNLRSQMNPHFLFNSLNSINDYIMHKDPKQASTYLAKFSKLMRKILNNSKQKLISLEEELAAVELYMELEALRFKNKFEFKIQVQEDINLENAKIPAMLIQPFLENSVKHGMKNLERKGEIILAITQEENDRITITIRDNGVGRHNASNLKSTSDFQRKSHGVNITTERINLLNSIYNVDASIQYIDHQNPTGTEVVISLLPIVKSKSKWIRSEQL